MTDSNHEFIASVLSNMADEPMYDAITISAVVREFARRLGSENAKFDEARFFKACKGQIQ
jgi:hypothetical protein